MGDKNKIRAQLEGLRRLIMRSHVKYRTSIESLPFVHVGVKESNFFF